MFILQSSEMTTNKWCMEHSSSLIIIISDISGMLTYSSMPLTLPDGQSGMRCTLHSMITIIMTICIFGYNLVIITFILAISSPKWHTRFRKVNEIFIVYQSKWNDMWNLWLVYTYSHGERGRDKLCYIILEGKKRKIQLFISCVKWENA